MKILAVGDIHLGRTRSWGETDAARGIVRPGTILVMSGAAPKAASAR